MRLSNTIASEFLSPAYRAFGRSASDQPYEPDGPRKTESVIERWRKRRRYRWHLRRLIECSPELLADINLTEDAAKSEIAKWFWRA